jgi:hypothetical protein
MAKDMFILFGLLLVLIFWSATIVLFCSHYPSWAFLFLLWYVGKRWIGIKIIRGGR